MLKMKILFVKIIQNPCNLCLYIYTHIKGCKCQFTPFRYYLTCSSISLPVAKFETHLSRHFHSSLIAITLSFIFFQEVRRLSTSLILQVSGDFLVLLISRIYRKIKLRTTKDKIILLFILNIFKKLLSTIRENRQSLPLSSFSTKKQDILYKQLCELTWAQTFSN